MCVYHTCVYHIYLCISFICTESRFVSLLDTEPKLTGISYLLWWTIHYYSLLLMKVFFYNVYMWLRVVNKLIFRNCSTFVGPSSHGCFTLRWRHNDHAGVSNHQPHGCLLNRLFRRKSKKTSKLRVTGLCAGNSPGTGEFPAQMASYAENVSIWWRHHDIVLLLNITWTYR